MYQYSIDNGKTWKPTDGTVETSYIFRELNADTLYNTIQVKALDILGNERISDNIGATTMKVQSWNGTIDTNWYANFPGKTVYNIYTAEELAGLASLVNAGEDFTGITINLKNDIILNSNYSSYSSYGSSAPSNAWTSIGLDADTCFNGIFEGNGKNINGLYIKNSNQYVGLFGYTGSESIIKNTNVINSYIYTQRNNSSLTGSIGGIVGYVCGQYISGCSNGTTIVSSSIWNNLGGIAGYLDVDKEIYHCYNTGSLSGQYSRGQ